MKKGLQPARYKGMLEFHKTDFLTCIVAAFDATCYPEKVYFRTNNSKTNMKY